jgi:hypothetical protein
MRNIIESIESEVSKLLKESTEKSNMAVAGYDADWYAGEMNAYEKVFNFIEKLKEKAKYQISLDDEDSEHYQEAIDDTIEIVKSSIIPEPVKKLTRKEQGKIICKHLKHDGDDLDESVMISSVWDALKEIEKINGSKDIKESKIIIGYDDFGKPLHEGDFCTFDINATNWRFKPDNIRKSGLATLEGQITYNEQDKCFELSIDNDYCPALYFHAIEPGTLSVKETKE